MPEQVRIIINTIVIIFARAGNMLIELLPYIIGGILIGEIIKYTSWTKAAYKLLSKSRILSIGGAVVSGVASPLCTYGTIPVVIQLFKAGIHSAPLLAFLASSALMNPQLFIITWGGLGPEIALVRLGSVMAFGVLLGLILYAIPPKWIVNKSLRTEDSSREEIHSRIPKRFSIGVFLKGTRESLLYFGFYILLGILAGAAVEVLIPGDWIASIFRPGDWLSVLIASIAGIPLYACGGGVIPLLASFISQGMSKGAALGFMIVGPATRITPLLSLGSIAKPLLLIIYVAFLVLFAFCVGIIYR